MSNVIQPKLRFPEFKDNWNIKKFNELFSFKSTNSLSRENLNYHSGVVKNIHYGDIHTKFESHFDIQKEKVPYINPEIDLTKISQDNFLKEGDLVIADASEDYNDIGKSIEIIDLNNEKVLAGLHTFLARKESKDLYTGFPTFVLKTRKVRLDIMKIAQGTKVLSLSSSRLGNISLDIPSYEEQNKIASFLTSIESYISLLKRKKTALERYKEVVMRKIFNLEIRFNDEHGNVFPDWEENRLGEICMKQSSNISANTLEENGGNFKIYGATGFLQYVNFYREEEPYISIVKDGAGVGRILLCEAKSSVLGTLDILKPKGENILAFLYLLISNIQFEKYITGSTIPHIYFKDYSKEKIMIPIPAEQKKIADFLSSIDKSIYTIEIEIKGTINFKKGLLQKMFV